MKILGLNTGFESLKYPEFDECKFNTYTSLLDYDAVVIDVGFLVRNSYGEMPETYQNKILLSEYYSQQIVDDYSKIRDQITELLKQGRTLFLLMGRNEKCYIYTGEKQFNGTGRNARQTNIVREFDPYAFLPIILNATHVYGNEIHICCNAPYSTFLKQTIESSQYASYFSIRVQHTVLATIKGTDKTIAAVIPYEQGKIVCLPQPFYEDEYTKPTYWRKNGKKYLDCLFELNKQLNAKEDEYTLPTWANDLYILGEKEERAKQNSLENRIAELQSELEAQIQRVDKIQRYKLLITSSGTTLEEIAKNVMREIGFEIFDSERGRSDIIAKYGEVGIVAEVKGVSKSAAEKHAAQLEKWVSQYIEKNEQMPKAMLIVNGFCDTPIIERNEEVFPDQMLKYCVARGHILITTTQLLCLYLEIKQNPACKEERINELLTAVGKYNRYQDTSPFILR